MQRKTWWLTILAVAMAALLAAAGYSAIRFGHRPSDDRLARLAELEIRQIEYGLVKMCTDSSREPRRFFHAEAFAEECRAYMQRHSVDAFEASCEIYTTVLTAFLRSGKNAPEALMASEETKPLARVLDEAALPQLGTSYLVDLAADPWGRPYRLFLGPWPQEWGPIVFRVYEDPSGSASEDLLTVSVMDDKGVERKLGFAAPVTEDFYIWSSGPDRVSDQARFDPSLRYDGPASRHYRPTAPPWCVGGCDDLNNWDEARTWRTPLRSRIRRVA